MKFDTKKLLIFDLDGTLIHSALDLALAINHTLTTLNRDTFSLEIIHGWVGNGALTLVKRALSGQRTIDEALDKALVANALDIFLTFYAHHLCEETVAYPQVTQTLKELTEKGYHLAIVTNKPFEFVSPILVKLGLDGIFELILGGDSLTEKKPHPAPLLHVCKTLGIAIEHSIMIGDSKNDILSANACAMQSIAVSYGYNYGEDITLHSPTVVIDNFGEILNYV